MDFHRRAHCRGAALNISKKSRFGERVAEPVTDDEVIEHPDIQERQRFLQAPRNELIRLAGLEHPGRMVVRKDHRRGVVPQRLPQHLARMHAGAVDRAAEELLEGDQPVAVVEVQAAYLNMGDRLRHSATQNARI